MDKTSSATPPLRQAALLAKLMDKQFLLPGTNFRFGLDGIIGLIPGAGDIATVAVSGYLLMLMARNGASGYVMARMVLNVLLDALIGAIPLVGDLFDFVFKANTRNFKLMEEHFVDGRHQGGAWKVVVPLLLLLGALTTFSIWLVYQSASWLYGWITGW